MSVKKKKKSVSNMTINIDTDYYEYLKEISYRLTAEERRRVGLSEVCRRALERYWPKP
jgi:hypothetical protein